MYNETHSIHSQMRDQIFNGEFTRGENRMSGSIHIIIEGEKWMRVNIWMHMWILYENTSHKVRSGVSDRDIIVSVFTINTHTHTRTHAHTYTYQYTHTTSRARIAGAHRLNAGPILQPSRPWSLLSAFFLTLSFICLDVCISCLSSFLPCLLCSPCLPAYLLACLSYILPFFFYLA